MTNKVIPHSKFSNDIKLQRTDIISSIDPTLELALEACAILGSSKIKNKKQLIDQRIAAHKELQKSLCDYSKINYDSLYKMDTTVATIARYIIRFLHNNINNPRSLRRLRFGSVLRKIDGRKLLSEKNVDILCKHLSILTLKGLQTLLSDLNSTFQSNIKSQTDYLKKNFPNYFALVESKNVPLRVNYATGTNVHGFYRRALCNGTVLNSISIDNDNNAREIFLTFAHELTHFVESSLNSKQKDKLAENIMHLLDNLENDVVIRHQLYEYFDALGDNLGKKSLYHVDPRALRNYYRSSDVSSEIIVRFFEVCALMGNKKINNIVDNIISSAIKGNDTSNLWKQCGNKMKQELSWLIKNKRRITQKVLKKNQWSVVR